MSPSLELKEYKFRVRVIQEKTVTLEDHDTVAGRARAEQAAIDECCQHGMLLSWSVEKI